jgi:hypothetical protein
MKKEKRNNAKTMKENKNHGLQSHYKCGIKKREKRNSEVRIEHGRPAL